MKPRAAAVVFCLFAAIAAHAGEGFGVLKKSADMKVRQPPAVNVTATHVKVSASAPDIMLPTERLEADVAAVLKKAHMDAEGDPDLTITIVLEGLKTHVHEKKDNKTSAHSTMTGRFTITDRAGKVIASGRIDNEYEHEETNWTPDKDAIEGDLLQWAADKIAGRIVPTMHATPVLLPRGSLESAIPLAQKNKWPEYLSALEAVPPNADLRSEAYREYAMGVATEGFAHTLADKSQALGLLQEAADHYRAAIRDNAGEKLFAQPYVSFFNSGDAPLARVEASIAAYEAWVRGTGAN